MRFGIDDLWLRLSNWRDNFWFNAIWDRWSVVVLVFYRRLAWSDVTVTSSVTCMDWLHWWYNDAALWVSSSTAWAFLTNMSEKRKSASPSAVQVKNCRKTIGIEEKLHVISRLEKGEWIVDICCNVRLTHSSVHTIHDNADRIKWEFFVRFSWLFSEM
jgi:IS30 family transposase